MQKIVYPAAEEYWYVLQEKVNEEFGEQLE
jgi:hypothetical protein